MIKYSSQRSEFTRSTSKSGQIESPEKRLLNETHVFDPKNELLEPLILDNDNEDRRMNNEIGINVQSVSTNENQEIRFNAFPSRMVKQYDEEHLKPLIKKVIKD